jgi:hypothetical protein
MSGVAKKYIIKFGCEKYFCRVTYSKPLKNVSKNFKQTYLVHGNIPIDTLVSNGLKPSGHILRSMDESGLGDGIVCQALWMK